MAEKMRHIFTSESVTEGHPDKVADQISDAVLDAVLADDPTGRVACEVLVTTGICVVSGEITTNTYVDVPRLARSVIHDIGYTDAAFGFDCKTCGVLNTIQSQSPDIAMGVDTGGAGDQGLMFGYACDETKELMPMPIMLAHKLVRQLSEVRRAGRLDFLRPDGKSQVSIEYVDGKPKRIDAVVVSTQHDDEVSTEDLRAEVKKHIIDPVAALRHGGFVHQVSHQSHRPLRDRRTARRHRSHRPQDHRRYLRRHGPARRRGVFGQGSDQSGPFGLLHGALHRQEPGGGWVGHALRSAAGLRHRRSRTGIRDGEHVRHRAIRGRAPGGADSRVCSRSRPRA